MPATTASPSLLCAHTHLGQAQAGLIDALDERGTWPVKTLRVRAAARRWSDADRAAELAREAAKVTVEAGALTQARLEGLRGALVYPVPSVTAAAARLQVSSWDTEPYRVASLGRRPWWELLPVGHDVTYLRYVAALWLHEAAQSAEG